MRYTMQTASGARYLINTDQMTWERARPVETQHGIIGLARDNGKLTKAPHPHLGERCQIDIEYPEDPIRPFNYISTTKVMRLEITDI